MNVLTGFLFVVVVMISLILIVLILVQPSKSGGLGSAFGSVGETVFGAQAMSHLSKLTVILVSVFFVLTLLLAVIAGHSGKQNQGTGVLDMAQNQTSAETSVQPEENAGKTAEVPVEKK